MVRSFFQLCLQLVSWSSHTRSGSMLECPASLPMTTEANKAICVTFGYFLNSSSSNRGQSFHSRSEVSAIHMNKHHCQQCHHSKNSKKPSLHPCFWIYKNDLKEYLGSCPYVYKETPIEFLPNRKGRWCSTLYILRLPTPLT